MTGEEASRDEEEDDVKGPRSRDDPLAPPWRKSDGLLDRLPVGLLEQIRSDMLNSLLFNFIANEGLLDRLLLGGLLFLLLLLLLLLLSLLLSLSLLLISSASIF